MKSEFKPAPVKPLISFGEIARVDIRAGTILSVAEVAGSDKLKAEQDETTIGY